MNISPGGERNCKSNWFRSGEECQFLFNDDAGSIQVSCADESDALCRDKIHAAETAVFALSSVAQQLADPEPPSSSIAPAPCTAPQLRSMRPLSELQSYAGQRPPLVKKKDKEKIRTSPKIWLLIRSGNFLLRMHLHPHVVLLYSAYQKKVFFEYVPASGRVSISFALAATSPGDQR